MFLKIATKTQRESKRISAVQYRIPLPVVEVLLFDNGNSFPICPRCDCTIEREYMCFCDRCGQRLAWAMFDFARTVHAPRS